MHKRQTQFIRASLMRDCKPAGGDSRSLPPCHGCVSPVGPRGKWPGNPAGHKSPAPAHTCGQTVHWEAGEQQRMCFLMTEKQRWSLR